MKIQELWENYSIVFRRHAESFLENKILTYASLIQLKDFPANLPEDFKKFFMEFMNNLGDLISSVIQHKVEGKEIPKRVESHLGLAEERLLTALTQFSFLKTEERGFGEFEMDDLLYLDFESNILNNGLVISFAFFESFLNESLRIIYQVKPEQLKTKEKSIDYETLFSFSTFEEIKNKILDNEVFNFSWKPLAKRYEFLRNIGIVFSKEDGEKTLKAEQVRHIIVHNNGKVNNLFIKNTNRKDLGIGENYPLDLTELDVIVDSMQNLLQEIFTSISLKFFGKDQNEIEEIIGMRI